MKTKRQMPSDYEQIKPLSSMRNMGLLIASANIKEYGFYTCLLDGVKTLVLSDDKYNKTNN